MAEPEPVPYKPPSHAPWRVVGLNAHINYGDEAASWTVRLELKQRPGDSLGPEPALLHPDARAVIASWLGPAPEEIEARRAQSEAEAAVDRARALAEPAAELGQPLFATDVLVALDGPKPAAGDA